MDKDRILERLKKDLRSLLIASKYGLSIQELERDYRMLIGSPLPIKSLEYKSTIDMLYDMPDVVTIQTEADGTKTLIGVINDETKGIAQLVSGQKSRRRTAVRRRRCPMSCRNKDMVRRGRIAPVLPAALKNDLQDLLSISPLLVSELETAYYNRFGRSFQYTRFGFYSLLEVLRSVSDMVQVNQTRAGSLLMLKPPYISRKFTGFSAEPVINQVTSGNFQPFSISKVGAQYTRTKPFTKNSPSPSISSTISPSTNVRFSRYKPTPPAVVPVTGPKAAPSATALPTDCMQAPSANVLFTSPTSTRFAPASSARPMPKQSTTALAGPECSTTALFTNSMPVPSTLVPLTAHGPASSATALSIGPTLLDKLFKAAETQYYANKYSVKNNDVSVCSETGNSAVNCNIEETSKTPASSLPPAVMQDTSTNSLVQPTPFVETGTAGNTCLASDDLKADIVETSVDCNLKELEEKLDKNLKMSLSKKASGVISPELRQEIKNIVQKYPEGLSISKFFCLYKEYTGKSLQFRELGFMSVLELVGSLGDMLYLENTKDGSLRLFNADQKEIMTGKAPLHNENATGWVSAAEKLVKPPVIKISAEGNQLQIPQDLKLSSKEQEIPPDAVRKQKLHSLPCIKHGFLVGVFVDSVTSPSEFYVRCCSKETSENLEDMLLEMRRCYSNEHVLDRYVVPDDCVSVGEIYAVRVAGDVWWYRVIVQSIINSNDVQVYFPDFGHLEIVKRQWLRFLKACYMKLPAQAVPSSLAYVRPVKDQWSAEAIKFFQQYCSRGPLVGVVVQYVLGRLYLFLCDTTTEEDVYLHQLLINQHHAKLNQVPDFYKDLPKYSRFDHFLIPSSEQPQEESKEPAENIGEFINEKEATLQEEEKTEPKMLFIEALPSGEDVFDERRTSLENTKPMNGSIKPSFENVEDLQSRNPSPDPAIGCAKRTDKDFLNQPLEEFYISLIKSRNSLETSSASLATSDDLYGNVAIPQPDASNTYHIPPITPMEEKPLPDNKNPVVFQELLSDDNATKGISPLPGFQKFKLPRRSTAVVLGPAARLAASPSTFLN